MKRSATQRRGGRHLLQVSAAVLALAGGAGGSTAAVLSAAPRHTVALADGWQFSADASLGEEAVRTGAGGDWQDVAVPHTWNALDGASTTQTTPDSKAYRRGVGWYRTRFQSGTGASHWLQFDGASIVAEVWLNGVRLGEHRGAFGAFRFKLDGALRNGSNVLVVKVDNREPQTAADSTAVIPLRGDFNMAGGLYRPVSLISTPGAAHLALDDHAGPGVYFRTVAVAADGTAQVALKVRTEHAGPDGPDRGYQLKAILRDAAGTVVRSLRQPVRHDDTELAMTVERAHLWQGVADPYLYQLTVELRDRSGRLVDTLAQAVGIRTMRFDPDLGFFLNGKPLPLHGVNLHQDYQGKAWAVSRADIDESLQLIREMGANSVRLAHYPHSAYTYEQASRLGLVVWAELPFVERSVLPADCKAGGAAPQALLDNATLQLKEMIRQHYNHASIAMWSIANEVGMGGTCQGADTVTAMLRQLNAQAKAEDPYRPTTLADFNEDLGALTAGFPKSATGGITDIWAVNRYPQWYYPMDRDTMLRTFDALHAKYPAQPLGVSEYGAGAALSQQTDNPLGGIVANMDMHGKSRTLYQPEGYASHVHEQVYAVLQSRPYLWGTYVWAMYDFGSGLRHEGDIGGTNTKGLVSFDRKTRKDPFYFYQANWSGQPVTHLTGKRYTERAYRYADVKAYSNAPRVRLVLNGQVVASVAAAQCPMATCSFHQVELRPGVNRVVVEGDYGGRVVSDAAEWRLSQDNADNVYIAAGQVATGFVSADGHRHGSDNFFAGGQGTTLEPDATYGPRFGTAVRNVTDAAERKLWLAIRHGSFGYDIPLANGKYLVTLGMLEPDRAATPGSRRFNVEANGAQRIAALDIMAEAGGVGVALWRSFEVEVVDGRLRLDFKPVAGEAVLSNVRIQRR
jgi:beta-galactosidase